MIESWKDRTDVAKNLLDTIKSLFLIVVVLILIFYTDFLNRLFDKYNVSQLEWGGIKIDRSEAIKILKQNADQIPQLKAKIDVANKQLEELRNRYAAETEALTALQAAYDQAVKDVKKPDHQPVGTNADKSAMALRAAIQNWADHWAGTLSEVDKAGDTLQIAATTASQASASLPAATGSTEVAIIYGSFPTLDQAKKEVEKGKDYGGDALVYLRQGRYRSAIKFSTMDDARNHVDEVRRSLSLDAYIVNLGSWCPKPAVNSDGFQDCQI
jgi:DNA repair exonuclease SbcCD ATPase subunit